MSAENEAKTPAAGVRMLCSHLVEVAAEGASDMTETALLEEIDSRGALLGSERAWGAGLRLDVDGGGFRFMALVSSCTRRENDFAVAVEFAGDFRWSPDAFRPDHLYAPPPRAKAKGAV